MPGLRLAAPGALLAAEVFAVAAVTVYPAPEGAARAPDFHVTVEGKEVFVHNSAVAAYAHFSFSGKVRVRVSLEPGVVFPESLHYSAWGMKFHPEPYRPPIARLDVRPKRLGIKPVIEGDSFSFDLPEPANLSIEINGNLLRPLFLFGAPPEENPPPPGGAKVRYFGPGKVHQAGRLEVGSGETVYIAGGAVVRGMIAVENARNVRIRGRGILDGSDPADTPGPMIEMRNSRDVSVEGIVILNDTGWTLVPRFSEDLRFDNIKMIAWGNNSDGVDICASKRVRIADSFLRNNDDCIPIKAAKEAAGDVEGVEVARCVLWNGLGGNAMEIGFELQTDLVRDIVFRRCDIIHVENGAAFSIHNGDRAVVRDVLFEDIWVEDARSELADIYIGLSIYSADCPWEYHRMNPKRKPLPAELRAEKWGDHSGQWLLLPGEEGKRRGVNRGRIENVVFRDITVLGDWPLTSRIIGYDGEHAARDVSFERLRVRGRAIRSAEEAGIVARHAPGLRFGSGRR